MVFGSKRLKKNKLYIINADRLENNYLINLSINVISNDNTIKKRIEAEWQIFQKIPGI